MKFSIYTQKHIYFFEFKKMILFVDKCKFIFLRKIENEKGTYRFNAY